MQLGGGGREVAALTLQLAGGFLLTVVTIWLIPWFEGATSWRTAFLLLVPGPLIGIEAMILLGFDESVAEFIESGAWQETYDEWVGQYLPDEQQQGPPDITLDEALKLFPLEK